MPGRLNTDADTESRKRYVIELEWRLSPSVFRTVNQLWGLLDIDLFVSRLNTQLPTYVASHHDSVAMAVDAFQ